MCYLDEGGKLLVEEDGDHHRIHSLDQFIDHLFVHNEMVFVRSLTDERVFPWLGDLVYRDDAVVICNRKGTPLGCRLVRSSKTRWIVLSSTWSEETIELSVDFLRNMRTLYDHFGCGVCATPGALGTQLMRKMWKEHKLKYHTACNGYADQFLRDHIVGGRVDTPGLGNFYEEAIEMDKAVAYLSEYDEQADGTSIIFKNGPSDSMVTWFAHCKVEITSELALGPFPLRLPNDRVVYPTLKGEYDVYLWREQAEKAVVAGCKVEPKEGVGWKAWTTDNSWWCDEAYRLKCTAPNKFVEQKAKGAIVAAIGRQAMDNVKYVLVPEDKATVFDVPVCGEGVPYAFFVHEEVMSNSVSMIHWNANTMQRVANDLYDFALPYAEEGRLIATNYDAVLVIEKDESRRYLKKYSIEAAVCPPGSWRWERLQNVLVVAPRSIICDQKIVLPGVPERARKNVKQHVHV